MLCLGGDPIPKATNMRLHKETSMGLPRKKSMGLPPPKNMGAGWGDDRQTVLHPAALAVTAVMMTEEGRGYLPPGA